MKLLLLVLSVFVFLPAFGQDCKKSTILFKSRKHEAKKKFLTHIDSILDRLHPDTTYLFEIHGHTDSNGTEEANYKLAQKRIEFAMKYVGEKKLPNIKMIWRNFGELSPISEKDKFNRRVNIFTTPINSDGTITVEGDNGASINVTSGYFNTCGYCLTHPKLKSKKAVKEQFKHAFEVNIETDCTNDITCLTVELRFPYSQFNSPSKIIAPIPVSIRRCNGGITMSMDSVDVDYYEKFKVSFDTLTNEYVVTHDCFNPYACFSICGGMRGSCALVGFQLPDAIQSKKTVYSYEYSGPESSNVVETIQLYDTNYFERRICGDDNIVIYGLGYENGEILFLRKQIERMEKVFVLDEAYFLFQVNRVIKISDYKPLEYLSTTIQLKVPRKLNPDNLGYYITELDYFIPIEHFKRRKYRKALLDFTFNFGIMKGDEFESIEYTDLKKRYRKRRKLLKVKIKKKNIEKLNNITIE